MGVPDRLATPGTGYRGKHKRRVEGHRASGIFRAKESWKFHRMHAWEALPIIACHTKKPRVNVQRTIDTRLAPF